jgi:type III restriction enzyme
VLKEVAAQYRPSQLEIEGVTAKPDIAAIVAKTTELVIQQTIDIPRILLVPTGKVQSGFNAFTLKVDTLNYPPVSEELWAKHLRTDQVDVISTGAGGVEELRLEDYVVSGLVDFDDVSYDAHADLLYDLAGQVVAHLRSYLHDEHEVRKVLGAFQKDIARFVHVQMEEHYWEKATGYEVKISKGFSELKPSAYTASATDPVLNYRHPPADKSNMAKYLFGQFKRCLYPVQKFQSDPERVLSTILEREATKWFKPAKGQFQIYYKSGADYLEYQPDFVAETADVIYMLEPKRRNEMTAPDVVAKKDVAVKWCIHATEHAKTCSGKPWKYLLIPHDAIAENVTLVWLEKQFTCA